MDRRRFVCLAAGSSLLATAGRCAWAQAPTYRLGILRPTAAFANDRLAGGIPRALAELGYKDGGNLVIDQRVADGQIEALPRLAREIVAARPNAIIAIGTAAARAAKDATTTIPIIVYGNLDPVASGLVPSLGRPGGNITGILIAAEGTLAGKKLELLKDVAPRAKRMALLAPADPGFALQLAEVRRAAQSLDVDLHVERVAGTEFERAFQDIVAAKCGALFVGATTHFVVSRRPIIDLAAKHRLPAIYEWPEQVADGGLMSYGGSLTETYRRLAGYVDRIFRGAQPAEMPIDQQTQFRLVINLGAARAIGLAIPPSVLVRADEVIA